MGSMRIPGGRSLGAAGKGAQHPHRKDAMSSAAEESRTWRYSWSLIATTMSRGADAAVITTRKEEELDSSAANCGRVRRRNSTSSLRSLQELRAESLGFASGQPTRPKTSHGLELKSSRSSASFPVFAKPSQKAGPMPTIMEKKYIEISTARSFVPKVRRWDAKTRTASDWDGLRKDSELYTQRGNCLVHLYGKGRSQRGPSLKIPVERVYAARLAAVFTTYQMDLSRPQLGVDDESEIVQRQCDLFVPAPDKVTQADAFQWHITTRNLFAFIMARPLVGSSLGQAMIQLRDRLESLRPNDARNQADIMTYFERAGYLDFAHCPDYALSMLNYAERYKLDDLWIDAFVHCVGMSEDLNKSSEYHYVSCVTQALITRAYLEMDLHTVRVTRALSTLLEEDFSPNNFGVSSAARNHLDRFRTFLHEYYVEKFGYWPPPKESNFSKGLYKSMYFDFQSLFDYLVDTDSSSVLADQKPASGGICVWQHVQAFDQRHKFMPLQHPHPLLPLEPSASRRSQPRRALSTLKIGPRLESAAELAASRRALAAATNGSDESVAPMVKQYQRFEREWRPDEKVSMTDARKVRWLLIYGTLQMLISVVRAPKEVRITDTTYPLCCLVTGTPPWKAGLKRLDRSVTGSMLPSMPNVRSLEVVKAISVQPDCESEYGSGSVASTDESSRPRSRHLSHQPSFSSLSRRDSVSTPSRIELMRNASKRSVASVMSVLSRGPSSRRPSNSRSLSSRASHPPAVRPSSSAMFPASPSRSPTSPSKTANFREIVIQGYGNGLNEAPASGLGSAPKVPSELSSNILPEIVVSAKSPLRPSFHLSTSRPGSSGASRPQSSRSIPPAELVLQSFGPNPKAPESARTPTLGSFIGQQSLPGLEISPSSSTRSTTSNVSATAAAIWNSSRSVSLQSTSSQSTVTESPSSWRASARECDFALTARSLHKEDLTPTSLDAPATPDDLHTPHPQPPHFRNSSDLPMVVDMEDLDSISTYQPSGVPAPELYNTTCDPDEESEEEFPLRNDSKRRSVASKRNSFIGAAGLIEVAGAPLRSSLRRTKTKSKRDSVRRSVKIIEDSTLWAQKLGTGPVRASTSVF